MSAAPPSRTAKGNCRPEIRNARNARTLDPEPDDRQLHLTPASHGQGSGYKNADCPAQTTNAAEHCTPVAVFVLSCSVLLQMLETGCPDLSFRVLLREGSRRREDALEEFRERIAGLLAIAVVMAVPLYGLVSSTDFTLVEESAAAEPNTVPRGLEPPLVNPQAVLSRLQTNELSPSDIRMVQTRLKDSGFDPGPIDGVAGKRTLAALNAYRQSISLSPVLIVSRETIGTLQHR